MARKEEIPIIHPRKVRMALEGFNNDVMYLLTIARSAHSFMTDETLDAEKVRHAITPQMKEGIDRVAKWYNAE
jgi:hypothetical protein